MHNVIIIGAGGHAKVVADIVIKAGDKLLGFLDDNKKASVLDGYDVIGTIKDCKNFSDDTEFVIAIGDNNVRKKISCEYNLKWYTAIHPSARIGICCQIGEGSVVMANAVINPCTKIGKHAIVNTAVVIEHDNVIDDFVHISPNATLCGEVTVGERTHIGASAVIKNGISIADNVIIGVGSAVVKDIEASGKYVGIPAKIMK